MESLAESPYRRLFSIPDTCPELKRSSARLLALASNFRSFAQPVACLKGGRAQAIDNLIGVLGACRTLRTPPRIPVVESWWVMELGSVKPACPKCARTDARVAISKARYAAKDMDFRHPIGTAYVYTCQCGAAFTHDDDITPPSEKANRYSLRKTREQLDASTCYVLSRRQGAPIIATLLGKSENEILRLIALGEVLSQSGRV